MQMLLKTVGPRVNDLYGQWARQYHADFCVAMPFTNVYGNKTFLQDQLEFIRMYLGFLLMDGSGRKQTVERVERFLSLQTTVPEAHVIEIHFVGGAPIEAIVCVEDLNDIDIADVHSIVDFDTMYVYKAERKRWTQKSAGAFIEDLRNDLEFDGCKVDLQYSFQRNQLIIDCGME